MQQASTCYVLQGMLHHFEVHALPKVPFGIPQVAPTLSSACLARKPTMTPSYSSSATFRAAFLGATTLATCQQISTASTPAVCESSALLFTCQNDSGFTCFYGCYGVSGNQARMLLQGRAFLVGHSEDYCQVQGVKTVHSPANGIRGAGAPIALGWRRTLS